MPDSPPRAVARQLLEIRVGMPEFSPWNPLTAATIDNVPDEPAVYEVGTLVRSVLFIGAAEAGQLKTTLASHLRPNGVQHPPGRLYFRYLVAADAPEQATRRLEDYRRSHLGGSPSWQHLTLRSRLGTSPDPPPKKAQHPPRSPRPLGRSLARD